VIGIDRLQDEFHDLGEQLIDIEDVADRLCGFVKCREADETRLEPGRAGYSRTREYLASEIRWHRADDRGWKAGIVIPGDQFDAFRQIVSGISRGPPCREHQDRLTDGDGISAAKRSFLNRVAVKKSSIAASEIDNLISAARYGPEFHMPAGYLRVVKGNGIRRVTADCNDLIDEIELLPFIHSAHDDQSGHNRILRAMPLRYIDAALQESVHCSVFGFQKSLTH
jgi:hypothetical protein